MNVYRVQRETGCGPYTFSLGITEFVNRLADAHNADLENHPTPQLDLGIGDEKFDSMLHDCGFSSIEQARQWFKGWGRELDEHGFRLVRYDISPRKVYLGEHQAVFRRGAAEPVESMTMQEAGIE